MLLLSLVHSLGCASHTLQSADETMVLILCLHCCFCMLTVCSPPCLPVGTAPGSKTCQDAQHKLFVLQFQWRTELLFRLNWAWVHCWLSALAAVSRCASPAYRCTHLAAEKLGSVGRVLRSHLETLIWGKGLCSSPVQLWYAPGTEKSSHTKA